MSASLTFAVPVAWDNTRTYEVNMIVFVGKRAYTAIQDVPVGIEISNESYWAETGVPEIDVEELEQTLSDIETAVSTNTSDISTANGKITQNTNDITNLSTRLTSAINSIEADAARLNNIMITLYTPVTPSTPSS